VSFEKYRKAYDCAVEGCDGKAIKKMSNHLISQHKITNPQERAKYLALSKKKGPQKNRI
jgi:hypothetical protein